jgi:hypothetical protein
MDHFSASAPAIESAPETNADNRVGLRRIAVIKAGIAMPTPKAPNLNMRAYRSRVSGRARGPSLQT